MAEGIKRLSKITGQQMRVEHDGEVIEGSFILGLISNTISVGGMKSLSHQACVLMMDCLKWSW